jgi:hypothetical protein
MWPKSNHLAVFALDLKSLVGSSNMLAWSCISHYWSKTVPTTLSNAYELWVSPVWLMGLALFGLVWEFRLIFSCGYLIDLWHFSYKQALISPVVMLKDNPLFISRISLYLTLIQWLCPLKSSSFGLPRFLSPASPQLRRSAWLHLFFTSLHCFLETLFKPITWGDCRVVFNCLPSQESLSFGVWYPVCRKTVFASLLYGYMVTEERGQWSGRNPILLPILARNRNKNNCFYESLCFGCNAFSIHG